MCLRVSLLLIVAVFAGCATSASTNSPAPSSASGDAQTGAADSAVAGSDAGGSADAAIASDTGTADTAFDIAETAKTYPAVVSTTVTKASTTQLYTLKLTGPMTVYVGQTVDMTLVIDTSGPVKFVDPKVNFQKAITGDKPLKPVKIAVAPPPLTWTITDIAPASPGIWKLAFALANGDGAEFDLDVKP